MRCSAVYLTLAYTIYASKVTGRKWDILRGVTNFILCSVLTRDKATYAAPAPSVAVSNHTRTLSSVCPWLLHMVIAYPGTKG